LPPLSRLGACEAKTLIELSEMRAYLELPRQPNLPLWLDGRHPLRLAEDGTLVDEDNEVLDQATFIRMRDEFRARILTNSPGKVAQALGFSGGGAAGIGRAVKITRYPKPNAAI
jgi:hypothetical protein